jgi:hypothetical protein
MKRLLIILGAVFLIFGLAEDGEVGKMQVILPKCPIHSSFSSTNHPCFKGVKGSSGKVDCQGGLLSTNLSTVPHQLYSQPLAVNFRHTLRIIDLCHSGSSGGIPL